MRDYDRYYQRVKNWSQQPKIRISGLASLTILTVAFFLYFAILPTVKNIVSLNKEIKDQQEIINKLGKKISNLETAEINYNQVINNLKSIDQLLPEKEEFERLAWQIQWLANQKGAEIVNGNFEKFNLTGQTDQASSELEMQLTIKGSFQQIKAFLQSLTKIDRLIIIKEVNFNKQGLQDESGLTANLKLSGF
ncbi:MAG: type 4a pilus biogenesis protein PilO, partial [Patescibacteria group bacterium]|nr:type 4a pilus biogenesis protein PilO [Patescibacteria group bacterium]